MDNLTAAPEAHPILNILLAEDDSTQRGLIERALIADSYQVEAVADGREAIKRLDSSRFDLVLCSVFLPESDAMQILMHLRKSGRQVPVMALCGDFRGAVFWRPVMRVLQFLGARKVLQKPVDLDTLLNEVRSVLGNSRPGELPTPDAHPPETEVDRPVSDNESELTGRGSKTPFDVAHELRAKALMGKLEHLPFKVSADAPEIYEVVFDWPVGDKFASVVAYSNGDARLYATSILGVVDGIGSERIRNASKALVREAQRHLAEAAAVTDTSYPTKEHVRFFFLTASGVRRIDFPVAAIENFEHRARELFIFGQDVFTELCAAAHR